MINDPKIQVEFSKQKLAKLLVFSIIFICMGLWMIIAKPEVSNPVFNNFVVKTIASYGSLIMGVLGVFFYGKRILNKEPAIVIDEHGISDKTSMCNLGVIAWNDISNIYESSVQASLTSKQWFVIIELLEPDKYISREKNPIKRKLLLANAGSCGSPVSISSNGLKTSHAELLLLLKGEYTRRGGGSW